MNRFVPKQEKDSCAAEPLLAIKQPTIREQIGVEKEHLLRR